MLIEALVRYYDILAKKGEMLPEGYSKVGVDYLAVISADGELVDIVDYSIRETIVDSKGKVKEKSIKRNIILPRRTEKTGIEANIIEHRPKYLFGLNALIDKESKEMYLSPNDDTNKARKSYKAFVDKNLVFLDGLDSPIVNAFRNFALNWNPDEQTTNKYLLRIGKKIETSSFAFCLEGHPEILLHEDETIKNKWDDIIS